MAVMHAIYLVLTFDSEVVEITIRSLYISLTATFIASLITILVGG